MDPLHHLIYQSSAVTPLNSPELGRLLEQSRHNNQLANITGVLLYDGSRFMQVLEGAEAAVHTIFGRIKVDCRHTGVQVLADGPIAHRQFPGWSMGLVDDVRQPGSSPGENMACLRTLTDAALWLLIREFQASAARSSRPMPF